MNLNITKEELFQKFHKKNWIHETDEIDIDEVDAVLLRSLQLILVR